MNDQRYALPAILLHWAQAILVIWLLWLGWTMVDMPKGAGRSAFFVLHKSLGLLAWFLIWPRLAWRLRHQPPEPLKGGWEARVAGLTHAGLYLFLFLAPLAGYLTSSFTPNAIKFFGLGFPKLGWPDEHLNGLFKSLHIFLVWSGACLIALHLAGAVKHALLRDGTLKRMLPGQLFRN